MKKLFYLLILALMPMCFTACGSDSDDSSDKKTGLVGLWSGTSDKDELSITFNKNGNGFCELTRYGKSKSSDPFSKSVAGSSRENVLVMTASFTYETEDDAEGTIYIPEGNVNYITRGAATYHYSFKIVGKKLQIVGYDDDPWVLTKQ